MQHAPGFAFAFPFIVWGLLGIPLAIGNGLLARRLGKSVVLWVVLTIIPVVNFVFVYCVMFMVIFAVLDRLAGVADDLRRLAPER
ncbi:MAG TPA: hypothetical protein VMU87_17635 [Stellaceae bacterium]|nr:hypothetical protein [Stellaceae bacterium]